MAQLRQRFATSGLTREQVHARLRAEGYPEDLLDASLPGMTGAAEVPSDDVFKAVRALGIMDSTDVATLQGISPSQRVRTAPQEKFDSAAFVRDSLRLKAESDSGFAIFGLDVFRSSTSQFEANLAGPVDANYRLGPATSSCSSSQATSKRGHSLDVTREGFVVIPQVGQIYVANLTLGQLDQLLGARLSRVYSGVRGNNQGTTRYSVSVARLRANQVYVVGDVQRPGSYTVSSAGTALTALYAAGGPTVNGTLRRVDVRRGGRTVGLAPQ